MTREQSEAHERLLTQLPVRTHYIPPPADKKYNQRVRTPAQIALLKKRARALRKRGWHVERIAKALRVNKKSVYNYLRKRTDY